MLKRLACGMIIMSFIVNILTSLFSMYAVKASATIYIRADGSIDPSTAPITRAESFYFLNSNIYDSIVIEKNDIVIDGAGFMIQSPSWWRGRGIDLSYRDNVTVENLTIVGFAVGIYLYNSKIIRISGNNLINNTIGIVLEEQACCNIIIRNNITHNERGIRLMQSLNNTIVENNIVSNYGGIYLVDSQFNFVYHNNFVDNEYQAGTFNSENNVWDDGYPSGGNYWSDYNGTDLYTGFFQNITGYDGIGDSAYVIDSKNSDRYPLLISLFSPQHDLVVFLEAPIHLKPGYSALLNASVRNNGRSDEMGVQLQLLINGSLFYSISNLTLHIGCSYMLSHVWSPIDEGIYEITAYAPPVSREENVKNNVKSLNVVVYTPPVVLLHPYNEKVTLGEIFTVDIVVANATDLYTWEIALYYRNDFLEAIEITEGPLLKSAGTTIWVAADRLGFRNYWNETHGRINVGCSLLGDDTGVNGTGVIATAKFKAKALGTSILELDKYGETFMLNHLGDEMLFETKDLCIIQVLPVEPPWWSSLWFWLFVVSLMAFSSSALAFIYKKKIPPLEEELLEAEKIYKALMELESKYSKHKLRSEDYIRTRQDYEKRLEELHEKVPFDKRYLAYLRALLRLEELIALGEIDEKTYEWLRRYYQQKIRKK